MRVTPLPAPPPPRGRSRLVVTGFMGTGKTEAGKLAAGLLGIPFIDLDDVIESRAGASISEIFARSGEPEFRRLEREAVTDAARLSQAVIATGGGAVLDANSFGQLAADATVAVLTCEPDELERRLGQSDGPDGRPLLADNPSQLIRELLDARAPAYAGAGKALDTTGRTVEEVAEELAERYRRAGSFTVSIDVTGPDGPYPVVVGVGAMAAIGSELRRALPRAARAIVVADESIDAPLGKAVARVLAADGLLDGPLSEGLPSGHLSIPAGERSKNIETVRRLWDAFVEQRLDRTDAVVAIGGGTITDVVGFAAATFGRGLPLVNVPTTLLGMVDAAIGGKTGIDHAGVKNAVGAFHHPKLVVADPLALATLPPATLRDGLAEAVKTAMLASPLMLDVLEGAPLDADGIPRSLLEWIVEQSVRIKAAYVAEDARDAGIRHSLNLGHTFAHGIEAATEYALPHGQAVAIGLVAAARLGEEVGVTPEGSRDRTERLLRRFGLPVEVPPGVDAARISMAMLSDKKRRAGQGVFVVPAQGGAALLEGIKGDRALEALAGLYRS